MKGIESKYFLKKRKKTSKYVKLEKCGHNREPILVNVHLGQRVLSPATQLLRGWQENKSCSSVQIAFAPRKAHP